MEGPVNGASFRPKEAQPGPSDEAMVTTMMKLREQLYKLPAKMYKKCLDSLRCLQRHPVGVLEREGEGPVGPGRVPECEGEDPTGSVGVLEREGASQVNPGREPCCAADGVPDPSVAPDGAERVDMVAPPPGVRRDGGKPRPQWGKNSKKYGGGAAPKRTCISCGEENCPRCCFHCKERGHIAARCPRKRAGSREEPASALPPLMATTGPVQAGPEAGRVSDLW